MAPISFEVDFQMRSSDPGDLGFPSSPTNCQNYNHPGFHVPPSSPVIQVPNVDEDLYSLDDLMRNRKHFTADPNTPSQPQRIFALPNIYAEDATERRSAEVLAATKEALTFIRHTLGLELGDLIKTVSGLHCTEFQDPQIQHEFKRLMECDSIPQIMANWYHPRKSTERGCEVEGAKDMKGIEEFALNTVIGKIRHDMKGIVKEMKKNSSDNDWVESAVKGLGLREMVREVAEAGPTFWRILEVACSSPRHWKHNPNPERVHLIVLHLCGTVAYTSNRNCGRLVKPWSMFLKACGLTARAFDGLHRIGLVMSHSWTCAQFGKLASGALETVKARIQKDGRVFFMNHDNVQLSLRVQSQRKDNQDQFLNLTAGTAFVLPAHVKLPENIVKQVQESRRVGSQKPFPIEKLLLSEESIQRDDRLFIRFRYIVLDMLLKSPEFAEYDAKDSEILTEPAPQELLSRNAEDQPEMFMLRTEDIDESSYEGTMKLVAEFLKQIGFKPDDTEGRKALAKKLVVWSGDRLTTERLRGMFEYRYDDSNTITRLDFMHIVFGWLHFEMVVANSIYDQHFGNGQSVGLKKAFMMLHRKHLDVKRTQGPFWHHLDEGLHHVAEGHILASWLTEGNACKLRDLKKLTPRALLDLAGLIVRKHASTEALLDLKEASGDNIDQQYQSSIMFTRDVLTYIELRRAIQSGDVGRLDDLIPTFLCRFAGGSESKYTNELLETLQSYQELTPEVKHFIRHHCWLVNYSGKPHGFVPIDQKQEHNIRDIKYTWRSMGPCAQLGYIQKISPAIPQLRFICRHMEKQFDGFKRGSRHQAPDKTKDVNMLVKSFILGGVHSRVDGRKIGGKGAKVPKDVVNAGARSLLKVVDSPITRWMTSRTFERSTKEVW